jgi:hypothetical protein
MDWHTIWFHYIYGSLLGNGPEAVIEIGIGILIGRLVWPRVKRHFELIHQHLDHIIEHSDIPPFEPKESK